MIIFSDLSKFCFDFGCFFTFVILDELCQIHQTERLIVGCWLVGWMDEPLDGMMDGWMHGSLKNGWTYNLMDGWLDGRTDGWAIKQKTPKVCKSNISFFWKTARFFQTESENDSLWVGNMNLKVIRRTIRLSGWIFLWFLKDILKPSICFGLSISEGQRR